MSDRSTDYANKFYSIDHPLRSFAEISSFYLAHTHKESRPTCGAKTRRGSNCKCRPAPGKLRCKFHGGFSTGPKTAEGKARIAAAQRKRWDRWRLDAREAPTNG